MKYQDGQTVRLWDRVLVWYDNPADGIVVASIDDSEYSPAYPEGWGYLGSGVLIETNQAGLMHFSEFAAEVRFVRRGGAPTDDEWAAVRPPSGSGTRGGTPPAPPSNTGQS